jgi:cobalt-zinc-cadmium efflux system outer membrane protein
MMISRTAVAAACFLLSGCASLGVRAPARETPPASAARPPDDGARTAATEAPADEDSLVRLALERSPRLVAARAHQEKTRGEGWQARLLPNPVVEAESEEIPEGGSLSDGLWSVGVEQTLPIGPSRFMSASAARASDRAAAYDLRAREAAVAAAVRSARVDLLFGREESNLRERAFEGARRILTTARARADAGDAPQSEVVRAELALARASLALREAEAATTSAEEALRAAVGAPALDLGPIAGGLPHESPAIDPAAAERCLLERSSELLAADEAASGARLRARAARWSFVPEPALRYAVGRDEAADEPFWEAGVSLEIPIFDRGQGDARAARGDADALAAEASLRETERVGELRALLARHDALRLEGGRLPEEILPAARRYLEASEEGYRQGKLGLLALLDAQSAFTEAEHLTLTTLRDAHLARIRIESLVGSDCASGESKGR